MEQQAVQSQILIFSSLLDLSRFVDRSLETHKSELSRYEDDLGQILRQAEQDNSTDEWAKEIMSKLKPEEKSKQDDKKTKGNERKERDKKKEKSKDDKSWVSYKNLQIFTGSPAKGKAQVYFEAVNELKAHIDKINTIRGALDQLASSGISNAFYIVYTKNGVPERIVLMPQGTQDHTKFEFKADFITENVEVPMENWEV